MISWDEITHERCEINCQGFNYWGIGNGENCVCGNTIPDISLQVADNQCGMSCSGDQTQNQCGGSNRWNIYTVRQYDLCFDEYVGFDFLSQGDSGQTNAASSLDCMQQCLDDSTCKGFIHIPTDTAGQPLSVVQPPGLCSFKTSPSGSNGNFLQNPSSIGVNSYQRKNNC